MKVLDVFGISWTDSQLQSLDMDANVAITAGAGSGKTQVLAARYLLAVDKLLRRSEYRGPESILVLTFTDKAASEMKDRIAKTMTKYICAETFAKLPAELRDRWLRFYEELPIGEISTIHSFCARVLRQYPAESKIDPEFSIIHGDDLNQLLEEAIRDVMAKRAASMDPGLQSLLKIWSPSRLIDMLSSIVNERDKLSEWIVRYSDRTSEELEEYQRSVIDEVARDTLRRLDTPECRRLVSEILNYRPLRDPAGDKLEEMRLLVSQTWSDCVASTTSDSVDYDAVNRLIALLCTRECEPRKFSRLGKTSVWGSDGKEYIGTRLELLAGIVASISELIRPFGPVDLVSIRVLKALALLSHSVIERFQTMKQQARVMDFSDLELRTRDLLRSYPAVRSALANRYRYVMVDEFQDTNAIQWEIIRSLCMDANCEFFSPGKLFLVGDEKQAIYSFRGGDVTTFAKARRELEASAAASKSTYREVVFGENFRSCKQLVDTFNFLFEKVLGTEEVSDFEAKFQKMIKANQKITQEGSAEIHLVRAPKGIDGMTVEAEIVARLAKEMVNNEVVKGFAEGKMPLVAILLRRMNVVKIYESALRRHWLEFSTVEGRGFFQQQEVLDVFNLLAFLSDVRRDIELFGVLRSPIFALTDEEIVQIIGNSEGTVWERLCRSALPKAVRCRETLERWRQLRDRCSVASLIRYILTDAGFYTPLAYGRRGKQKLANVEKVIALARSADAKGQGLAAFVASLERQIESEEKEGEADVSVNTPIVLMTIHKAKGLQFPAVIVPDLAGSFNLGTDSTVYVGELNGRIELGIKAPDPDKQGELETTAFRTLIKRFNRDRELAEQKRLLYVAATRAHLMLAMVGQAPEKPVTGSDYYSLNSWAEWLCKALELKSPDLAAAEPGEPTGSFGNVAYVRRLPVGPLTVVYHLVGSAQFEESEQPTVEASGETAVIRDLGRGLGQNALLEQKLEALDRAAAIQRGSTAPPARMNFRRIIELSATAVMDFEKCPRLYYLRHFLKVPEHLLGVAVDPSGEVDQETVLTTTFGAKLGDLFHRLIALEIYDPEDARIKTVVSSLLSPIDLPLANTYVSRIKEHLKAFKSLGYPDLLRKLRPQEKRCELALDVVIESTDEYEVRFVGFIDMLISPAHSSWRILDFKTNSLNGVPVDRFTSDHLYDLQMELYMAAAELALKKAKAADRVDKAEIVYTSIGSKYEVDPNPNVMDKVLNIAKRVYKGDFSQRSGECQSCVYRPFCER